MSYRHGYLLVEIKADVWQIRYLAKLRTGLRFESLLSFIHFYENFIVFVQPLSHVWLFVTPRIVAHQAPLSSTVSQTFLKLMSIESVMLSNHLILCRSLLFLSSIFPSIRVFSNELLYTSGGQSIGASATQSVLPMDVQGWFPLGLTGLISLQYRGLWRVFSSTTIWKHEFFGTQPSLRSSSHIRTWLLEKP